MSNNGIALRAFFINKTRTKKNQNQKQTDKNTTTTKTEKLKQKKFLLLDKTILWALQENTANTICVSTELIN